MKQTASRPEFSPIPPECRLPFWLHLKALLSCVTVLAVSPPAGSCPPSNLALVQPPRWLCFGGFGRGSVSANPPAPFGSSTPGSWPPARHADQWEIQAQASCLGWHFAFVFPSRL